MMWRTFTKTIPTRYRVTKQPTSNIHTDALCICIIHFRLSTFTVLSINLSVHLLKPLLNLYSYGGPNAFLNTPIVASTTNSNTPPPGPSLNTFGTKPLYSAATPSSRATVSSAG
jgi:hypothetical protein